MPPKEWDEGVVAKIEALRHDIEERRTSIEDGSYYDDRYYRSRRRRDYEDEEPDNVSEEQRGELEALFEDADQLFLAGQLDKARQVYAELLGLLDGFDESDEENEPFIPTYSLSIGVRETRARYCR